MFYKVFYHREMWYLNTRKNTIFLHVKISIISLTSGLSLKLYLNSLVYHRNIFGSSSKVLGNLRTSSENFRKFSENVRERLSGLRDNLKNLRKSSEGGRKSSENHQKRRHQYVYIIKRILHFSSKIWILCSRGKSNILFLSLEHKIHIFSPPCNILYVNSYFIFTFYIRTSTNGHLSTTATLFCPGGRSIHLLLFKPLHDGHLSTAATDVNACPQLPK